MEREYDIVIIGCGPAGLSAAIYAGRSRLKVLLLGTESAGGAMRSIELIENYPGFPEGVSGAKLGMDMMKQAIKYGIHFKLARVEGIELQDGQKMINARLIMAGRTEQALFASKTVIIAGGAHPKKLGVPGEAEFLGKGVSYCGVCDGPQFAERAVAVAGGGDAGLTEAMYLARLASNVIVIEFMPCPTASKILQERAMAKPNMEIRCGMTIKAITGSDHVSGLQILDRSTNQAMALPVGGVVVRIGLEPNTDYLRGLIALDPEGYALVNEEMETNVPGIFAAGDVRHASVRQVATAVGDGVTAAISACRLIS
jgi:thioredoxin reductase (NADPH)